MTDNFLPSSTKLVGQSVAHVYKLSAYCAPAWARRINLNLAAEPLRVTPVTTITTPTTTRKMKWHEGIGRMGLPCIVRSTA